jgi:phosphate transport system permease protein
MAAALVSVLILAVLLGSIVVRGWDHLDWAFLNNFPSRNAAEAGLKAALWGTVWLCATCMFIALPLGVGAAILLEEYAPNPRWAKRAHSFVQLNISNLAGVPSIVYGIIGLTVFVRCFGLLGNPNQYDQMIRATLSNGKILEGMLIEDRPESVVIDVTGVSGAAQAQGMAWPTGVEVSLALVQGDTKHLSSAVPGTPVRFEIPRDYNLPLDLAFALAPAEDSVTPIVLKVDGVFRELRPGLLVLNGPMEGRMEVPTATLLARESFAVRIHEFSLKSGEVARGESLSIGVESVTLLSHGLTRTIGRDEIGSYRAVGPLAIGREDSFFYVRLPLGGSVLAGALTLMLVILPVVIISSQEALRAVPKSLREGAFAAGATRWQMVSRMVLPSAMPGIMTGAILAMSRAIGEAAPLLVVGGFLFITFTPTNVMSDFAAMPLQIYQWASRPQPEFYDVAAAGIMVLVAVLLAFNAAAILIRQKFQKRTR